MTGMDAMKRYYSCSLSIALPLAVIRCGGWPGLAAQVLVLLCAAALLNQTSTEAAGNRVAVELPSRKAPSAAGESRRI